MRAYNCFWLIKHQDTPVLDPLFYGILYRVPSATVYENEGRKSIVLCLDGLSALPDLLCDALYRNDRIGPDICRRFVREEYHTEWRGASG
jgi:hypothetical protein